MVDPRRQVPLVMVAAVDLEAMEVPLVVLDLVMEIPLETAVAANKSRHLLLSLAPLSIS